MKCRIGHFYNGGDKPPVPEAVRVDDPSNGKFWWEVEIDDLFEFAKKHGALRIHPPGFFPHREGWFVWVTSADGAFSQR